MSLVFPLYILLFVYLIFLAIFAIIMVANFYHIISTETLTLPSFAVTFFVLATTILVLYSTWFLLQGVDWRQPIPLFNGEWLGTTGNLE